MAFPTWRNNTRLLNTSCENQSRVQPLSYDETPAVDDCVFLQNVVWHLYGRGYVNIIEEGVPANDSIVFHVRAGSELFPR